MNHCVQYTKKCVLCKWNNHSKPIKISHQLLGNHVTTCVYFVDPRVSWDKTSEMPRVVSDICWRRPRVRYPRQTEIFWPAGRLTTRGELGEWSVGNYRWGGTKCANNVLNIAANELQDCKMKDNVGRHQMTVSNILGIYR